MLLGLKSTYFFEFYLMVGPTLLLIYALNSGQNIIVWVGMGYSPNDNLISYEQMNEWTK